MKKLFALMMVLMLSACGLCPEKRVEVPVEVKVPVPVRCKVMYPEKPVPITSKEVPKDFYGKGVSILAENEESRRYANELEAVLKKCADPE